MASPSDTGRGAAASSPPRLPRDAVVGGAVLAFCAAAFAVTLTFDEAPAALAQNVQPARFPQLVLAVMAVLAAILVVRAFALSATPLKPVKRMVLISAAILVGFVVTIDLVGFFEAAMLLCLALPPVWGERRWRLVVPYALALPAGLWVLFVQVLDVYFEPGLIGRLLG
jgi:putative tricarboxylic transport membrane protein